jgi:ATPase subunit of ABC transporter with duplicated ATPase domains
MSNNLISLTDVQLAFGHHPLLDHADLVIQRNERIGLIGRNGAGKSSLLKILDQRQAPDDGQVQRLGGLKIATVEQEPELNPELSIYDFLCGDFTETEDWQRPARVNALMDKLGLDPDALTGSLSGGQRKRVALANALVEEPDLLLLDEPSNHLDLPSLLWLESFLSSWRGTFVLVSHDQRLLDRVCNSTIILRDRTLSFFSLPCSAAREALRNRDEADLRRHQGEQKEIDRIEQSAKRLAIWGQVYDNETFARKAQSMEKRLSKLRENQTDLTDGTPWTLQLHGLDMKADRLLDIAEMAVSPAENLPALFQAHGLQVRSGDRIGLVGRNGCGKSSLLRQLWRYWQAEAHMDGLKFHPQCRIGYYDQDQQQLDGSKTLLHALQDFSPLPDDVRKMALISAGFPYLRHAQKVDSLSGGERARLMFIALSLANYHLLFLDEPTNHLDLEGKEELAEELCGFKGGFILVTHDRELLEKSCNRFWLVDEGSLTEMQDLTQLYASLVQTDLPEESSPASSPGILGTKTAISALSSDDSLLEQLIELESKLEADLARKPKHQKPGLQEAWQAEIHKLRQALNLE